jgi:hypothetical protein
VLLLEVVIALSILLIAIAVCGSAINNSLLSVKRGEEMTRAMMLSEEILARLDTADLTFDQEQSGNFEDRGQRDLRYELKITPVEQDPDLLRVEISILENDPTANDGQTRPVLVTRALRAKPKPMNMKNDFGMTDEQLKMLTDAIPGGSQVIDPENFDPTSLAKMDMNTLVQLLPVIMQAMQSGQMNPQMMGDLSQLGQGGLPGGMLPGMGQPGGGAGGAGGSGAGGGRKGGGRPRPSTSQPGGG